MWSQYFSRESFHEPNFRRTEHPRVWMSRTRRMDTPNELRFRQGRGALDDLAKGE